MNGNELDFNIAAEILTDRLLLRQLTQQDIDSVHEIHSNPKTNLYNPSGPATREISELNLQQWISHWENFKFGYWAVCLPNKPDHPIGFGGIIRKNIGERYGLNLYFRFSPESWGKGYATETAKAALILAFDQLHESEVLAKVRDNNIASRRTLERIGMSKTDEVNDIAGAKPSLIYSVTALNFKKRSQNER